MGNRRTFDHCGQCQNYNYRCFFTALNYYWCCPGYCDITWHLPVRRYDFQRLCYWVLIVARQLVFSFLMVVPLILGKIAKDLVDGGLQINSDQVSILWAGFLAAFLTGLFACQWMIKLVRKAQLKYFSYYCFIAGTIAIGYQQF